MDTILIEGLVGIPVVTLLAIAIILGIIQTRQTTQLMSRFASIMGRQVDSVERLDRDISKRHADNIEHQRNGMSILNQQTLALSNLVRAIEALMTKIEAGFGNLGAQHRHEARSSMDLISEIEKRIIETNDLHKAEVRNALMTLGKALFSIKEDNGQTRQVLGEIKDLLENTLAYLTNGNGKPPDPEVQEQEQEGDNGQPIE